MEGVDNMLIRPKHFWSNCCPFIEREFLRCRFKGVFFNKTQTFLALRTLYTESERVTEMIELSVI